MSGDTPTREIPATEPLTDEVLRPSHIAGIGASAGGLEALEQLFEKMPARTGLAFIVVQHLGGLSVEGVVLTPIDIGGLKRAEADAQRQDQQLVGILDNSPNPIAITDREGRY